MNQPYAWVCCDCHERFDDIVVARRHDTHHQVITLHARTDLIIDDAVLAQPLGPGKPTNLRQLVDRVVETVGRRFGRN